MPQDARAAFSRAAELHRQGRYEDAIELYRRVLLAQPGALDVQRLLTFALLQAGHTQEALATARQVCEANAERSEAHLLMGAVYQVMRQWDLALAAFETACRLRPDYAEVHYLAGNALAALGHHGEAVDRYGRALELDPQAIDARTNRARVLSRLGRFDEALAECENLATQAPQESRHWLLKAGILLDSGHYAETIAIAEAALLLDPRQSEGHLLHGQGLEGLGRYEEARKAFNAALACAPQRSEIHARLAGLERRRNHPDRAVAICDTALALDPACSAVLYERGEARRELGDLDGALVDVNGALERGSDDAAALTLKARLMADLGDPDAARRCVDSACRIDPHYPMAIYLRALDHLAGGRWDEGWKGYESRSWFLPAPYENLPFQRWDGVETPEELIVVGEAHVSDLLLFARLLRLLADRGPVIRLLTQPRHVALMSRVDARVLVMGDLSGVDVTRPGLRWVPMGSLPGLISPDPSGWPRPPYLMADPERVGRWRSFLEGTKGHLRIGISWQDDPAPTVDAGRSVPLEAFAPLAELEGISLVSLQRGPAASHIARVPFAGRILQLPPDCDADGTFVDTSGILQHLDLVVTHDSALCHLAGARARPTFAALRMVPDWYWGLSGDTTGLYPSVRLFRQSRVGDWQGVFAAMTDAVLRLREERKPVEIAPEEEVQTEEAPLPE